jgi:hypothetical protein
MSLYKNEENQNRGRTEIKKTSHPYAKLKISKGGDKKKNICPYVKMKEIKMGDIQK